MVLESWRDSNLTIEPAMALSLTLFLTKNQTSSLVYSLHIQDFFIFIKLNHSILYASWRIMKASKIKTQHNKRQKEFSSKQKKDNRFRRGTSMKIHFHPVSFSSNILVLSFPFHIIFNDLRTKYVGLLRKRRIQENSLIK